MTPASYTKRYHLAEIPDRGLTSAVCEEPACTANHVALTETSPGTHTLVDSGQARDAFQIRALEDGRSSFTGVLGHFAGPPRSDDEEPNYFELVTITAPDSNGALESLFDMYAYYGSEEGCKALFAAHGYVLADDADRRAAVGLCPPVERKRIPAPRLGYPDAPWFTHHGVPLFRVALTSLWFTTCGECFAIGNARRDKRILPHTFDIRHLPNPHGYDLEALTHEVWFNRFPDATRTMLQQLEVLRDAIDAGVLTSGSHTDAPYTALQGHDHASITG